MALKIEGTMAKIIKISESAFNRILESTDSSESGCIEQPTFPMMRRTFAFKKDGEKPKIDESIKKR